MLSKSAVVLTFIKSWGLYHPLPPYNSGILYLVWLLEGTGAPTLPK